MFNRFKKLAAVAAVAVATGVGSTDSAFAGVAPLTVGLDTLLDGGNNQGGITLGDKRFTNFNFSSTGQMTLDASDVEVIFAIEDNTHFLAFLMDLSAAGTGRSDVVIGYDVNVLDPARTINSVGLLFDGGPFDGGPVELGPVIQGVAGRAAASVVETVSTLDGSDLVAGGIDQDTEIITVINDGDGPASDNFETSLAINPTKGLRFVKDILVSSRGNAGADLTFVENSVTQNGTVIPLPAAFWAAIPVFGLIAGKKVRLGKRS